MSIDVKKIAFSFITIVVIPLLFFLLLEFILWGAGVGTSYTFFNKIDIDGKEYYQENPHFADQFYPASLDITPRESTFAVEPDDDIVRVMILGGSAALGFPHKNHGIDRLLAAQLADALPGKKIEIVNTAMTSVNSHVVYAVADSVPEDVADFAVILMGNNEVVGPYGPGTLNRNFTGSIGMIRGIQALKRTRLWQGLDGLFQGLRSTEAIEELEWQGMQMFTNNGVALNDERMQGVFSHYEDNLTDVIETLTDKGMHVVLSSVPVNLRHSAPFLSMPYAQLSPEQLGAWEEQSRLADEAYARQDWTATVAHYQAALEVRTGYADTHFGLAVGFENLGDHEQAKLHYQRALDLDGLRFRADSFINRVIEDYANTTEVDAFSYVDSANAFARASAPYEPGFMLLLEHVHYSFEGNHLLATEIAEAIVGELAPDRHYKPLRIEEMARRVGYPSYDTPAELDTLLAMIELPPFPGQRNYDDLKASLGQRRQEVIASLVRPTDMIRLRRSVVASGHADWKMHFELAVLSERQRDMAAMYGHLNAIVSLYPHNRETYMRLAQAKSREGKWSEAIPHFERTLFYTRGDDSLTAESTARLGVANLRSGNVDVAVDQLRGVIRDYPDEVAAVLLSYGNLVRSSRDRRRSIELKRYIDEVQRYGNALVESGEASNYPQLNQTMAQILTIGGYPEEARRWATMDSQ